MVSQAVKLGCAICVRKLTSMGCANQVVSLDKDSQIENRNLTLFSRVQQEFHQIVRHALSLSVTDNVVETIFQSFKKSYASLAYVCRVSTCPRSISGFDT